MKFKWSIAIITILVASTAAFFGHLGYFGGPIFKLVPATAAPARSERGLAAVLLSGDMGFNIGMGPKVAQRLAADGIPVLGVNSLTYFRHKRTPQEAEALIAQAMQRALALPGTTRLVLIGQSFGADMLNVGLPYLPPSLRHKLIMVALVVPGDTIDLRASPSELFGMVPPDAPALPTARKLNWIPVLCIHGAMETDSLCPLFSMPNVERVTLPGGHALNRDADKVHAVIKHAIAQADAE